MAKDKKILNEALDLLDGICGKVALNRETHMQVQMSTQVIRAELNKKEEEPKKEEVKDAKSAEKDQRYYEGGCI